MTARKYLLVLLAVLALFTLTALVAAKPVAKEAAAKAAVNWLKRHPKPLGAKLTQRIKSVKSYADADDNNILYVVQLSPSGLVILSADDMVSPVVGFSTDGTFDPSEENPLGALAMRDLSNRSREAREAQATGGKQTKAGEAKFALAQNHWQKLLAEDAASTVPLTVVSDPRVDPLVQSKWNQFTENRQACYNYYTPPGPDGSPTNYVCGCVATAMAQLMRYYQYPTQGVDTQIVIFSVNDKLTTGALRGGDGLGGPYNWSQMTLVPDSSITTVSRQAIGALCYDAGIAARTIYTPNGSISGLSDGPRIPIITNFGYSNGHIAQQYINNGRGYILTGFNNIVNPNLDAGYPVLVGINGSIGGHAIICDGYGYESSTPYYHLNMGWSGYADVWYNLPNIDVGSANWDAVTMCLYNIYVDGTGEIISGRVTDDSGQPRARVTVTAQTTQGDSSWTAVTNSRGIYAIAKIPALTEYRVSITSPTLESQNIKTGIYVSPWEYSGNIWGVNFPPPLPKSSTKNWTLYQ